VAILSKSEPHDVRSALCDEVVDPQARVIAATIDTVRVLSVYAPNGRAVGSPAYQYKLQWYARLRDCLLQEKSAELLICGDFNVAPEDIDVYEPDLWRGAIMCSDGERAAFRQLCDSGLRDTLRLHHKYGGLFSWWDYRMLSFPKNRGLRIDGILASKALAKKCTDAGIDRDMRKGREPSDHAPVWAKFNVSALT
jgi:exodeoxyribonuclease-3